MVFQEDVNGPLCMTIHNIIAKTFGHYDDPPLKDKTKAERLGDFKCAGVNMSVVKGDRVGELQDIYREKLIPVTNIIRK